MNRIAYFTTISVYCFNLDGLNAHMDSDIQYWQRNSSCAYFDLMHNASHAKNQVMNNHASLKDSVSYEDCKEDNYMLNEMEISG